MQLYTLISLTRLYQLLHIFNANDLTAVCYIIFLIILEVLLVRLLMINRYCHNLEFVNKLRADLVSCLNRVVNLY